jgi:hypothetical protein
MTDKDFLKLAIEGNNIKPRQIAIIGFNLNHHKNVDDWYSNQSNGSMIEPIKIKVIHIPAFIKEITN